VALEARAPEHVQVSLAGFGDVFQEGFLAPLPDQAGRGQGRDRQQADTEDANSYLPR
jgi:hypothetical protein